MNRAVADAGGVKTQLNFILNGAGALVLLSIANKLNEGPRKGRGRRVERWLRRRLTQRSYHHVPPSLIEVLVDDSL